MARIPSRESVRRAAQLLWRKAQSFRQKVTGAVVLGGSFLSILLQATQIHFEWRRGAPVETPQDTKTMKIVEALQNSWPWNKDNSDVTRSEDSPPSLIGTLGTRFSKSFGKTPVEENEIEEDPRHRTKGRVRKFTESDES